MRPRRLLPLLAVLLMAGGCAASRPAAPPPAPPPAPASYFEILTPEGRMVVHLFDQTPLHRDNFRKLVDEGYFDSTTFHRVIEGFMIQGGDPNTRDADPADDGLGDPGYTLPAELHPELFHRRGALAAAREGDDVNPERRSSGSQFYIVQGTVVDSTRLALMEQRVRRATGDTTFHYSPEVRAAYRTVGGAPHLDTQYTVFGELVEGFDVLDRIAAAPTPHTTGQSAPPEAIDRPLMPIRMAIRPLPGYRQP